MRKFFVYFLLLGVFTLTAQLVSAEVPSWMTANYPEDEYLSQPILQHAGGDNFENLVTDAKKKLMRELFQGANSFFNPRQKQLKNKWVPEAEQKVLEQEYSTALTNLGGMRATESHVAKLIEQVAIRPSPSIPSNSGRYVLVNAKRQEMMRAYIEREQRLQEQINVMIARATQFEAYNPQRSLEAYLQALPLYEQLKEAVLIQQAVTSPEQQDPAAIYKKLQETAIGTNGDALQMALPEVNNRINQLQHQGRMMNTVEEIAGAITQQLAVQTQGLTKGDIRIDGFKYRRSDQSIAQYNDLRKVLIPLLQRDGWRVVPPGRGMKEVSIHLQASAWDGVDGGTLRATMRNLDTGNMVGSSTLNLSADFAQGFKTANFDLMQENQVALESIPVSTSQQQILTGQELKLKAWTDQGVNNAAYREGDLMTVYCRVNQPAYVRLIYVLADDQQQGSKYTLLHDNTYIGAGEVGSPVEIGKFLAAPPFGSEQLIVLAQKKPFSPVKTLRENGYSYLDVESARDAINMLVPKTRGMKKPPPRVHSINITTAK